MIYDSGLSGSLSDFFKKNEKVLIPVGAAAGGALLTLGATRLVPQIQDWNAERRARREKERALYGGHEIAWWTEKGMKPGDQAALARYYALKNASKMASAAGATVAYNPISGALTGSGTPAGSPPGYPAATALPSPYSAPSPLYTPTGAARGGGGVLANLPPWALPVGIGIAALALGGFLGGRRGRKAG